jgi:hypothetical protein
LKIGLNFEALYESYFVQKCLDMLELEQPIVNAIQYLPSKDMVVLDDSDDEKNSDCKLKLI